MTIEDGLARLPPLLAEFRDRAPETDASGQLPRRHLEALGQAGDRWTSPDLHWLSLRLCGKSC